MALDHIRLDLENKFLENKSGQTFELNMYKFTLQNLPNKSERLQTSEHFMPF